MSSCGNDCHCHNIDYKTIIFHDERLAHSVQISHTIVASIVKAITHRMGSFTSLREQEPGWGRINKKHSKGQEKDEKLGL